MSREKIVKTYTITADVDTMKRFEKLLCMMHYNGGHSGLFGLYFDGDGSDVLKCDPPPPKGNCDWRHLGGIGQDVEIACTNMCSTRPINSDKHYYIVEGNKLYIVKNGVKILKKEYDES